MRSFTLAIVLLTTAGAAARAQEAERRPAPAKAAVRPPQGASRPAPAAGSIPLATVAGTATTGATPPSGAFTPPGSTAPISRAPVKPETREAMVRRAYAAGLANTRVKPVDAGGWSIIARMTGLAYDDLVRAYDAVYVVDFAQRYLLKRGVVAADSARVVGLVNRLRAGERWEAVWRDVAQSPERERQFGFFAPAPIASPAEARSAFGLGFTPTPEQCFGALGDKCEGGIPGIVNGQVQPTWTDTFTLPDGTQMGFVMIGVAVGSILHDNSCLRDHGGLNCNGIGAGDLIKHGGPADDEWNKAAWNVMDHRAWRDRFGPYPVDKDARRSRWYDDLRPVPSREAWMAPSLGMVTIPVTTIRYAGGETRQTQQLAAPAGTWLDERDGAFCRSKTLAKQLTLPPKSAAGTCR